MKKLSKSTMRIKRFRDRLFDQQKGRCCFCFEPMIHWDDPSYPRPDRRESHVPRQATVEHMYPRGHEIRDCNRTYMETGFADLRLAVSCHECNDLRNQEFHLDEARREEQRRRSRQGLIDKKMRAQEQREVSEHGAGRNRFIREYQVAGDGCEELFRFLCRSLGRKLLALGR